MAEMLVQPLQVSKKADARSLARSAVVDVEAASTSTDACSSSRPSDCHSETLDSPSALSTSPSLWELDRRKAMFVFMCYTISLASVSFWEVTFTLFQEHLDGALETSTLPLSKVHVITNSAFSFEIIIYALLPPACVLLKERFGYRLLLTVVCLCSIGAAVGLATVSKPVAIYISFALGGLSVGCMYVPSVAASVMLVPVNLRSVASSVAASAYLLGGMAYGYPTRCVIEAYGFRRAYLYIGMFAACIQGLVFLVFPRSQSGGRRGGKDNVDRMQDTTDPPRLEPLQFDKSPEIVRDDEPIIVTVEPGWMPLVLLYLTIFLGSTMYVFMESQLLSIMEVMMPGSVFIGFAVPTYSACSLIGRLSWGIVATRISCRCCMVIGYLAVAAAAVVWSCASQWPFLQMCCMAIISVGANVQFALIAVILTEMYGARGGAMLGIVLTAEVFSAWTVPFLGIIAAAVGWQSMLWMISAIPIGAAVLVLIGMRRGGRAGSDTNENEMTVNIA